MRSVFILAGALVVGAGLVSVHTATSQTTAKQGPSAPSASQATQVNGNIEHGNYIVHNVAMCFECHSPRDAQGNIIESQEFDGGPIPVRPPWGDWALIAPRNKGLPGYDDEQAMRLLTEGAIGRDGKQLRPPMPRFHMTKQDAADVIAYMRSLK